MTKNVDEKEQADTIERLKALFPEGSTVVTVLRHVSQSGTTRAISVLANGEQGPDDVSYLVRRVVEREMDHKHGGITVRGTGMDMAFSLVYDLAAHLYGNGYALKQRTI